MDTKQLLLAIRLSETLHFGKTAEIENIAQSGLSAQIAKLEGELGFSIFRRTNRRVELSAAGATFIEHARDLLAGLNSKIHECREFSQDSRCSFRMGFIGEAAGELTHPIFELFRRCSPRIRFSVRELNMTEQVQSLLDGSVDALFVRLPVLDERLDLVPMFDEPRVAAVPKYHEMADAISLGTQDLADKPFAVAAEGAPNGWASYWSLSDDGQVPRRIGAEVKSLPESLAAIAYSGAFDTFPLSAARAFTHPGVSFVPLKDAPRSTIAFATLRGSRNPAIHSIRQCIDETLTTSLSRVAEARRCTTSAGFASH